MGSMLCCSPVAVSPISPLTVLDNKDLGLFSRGDSAANVSIAYASKHEIQTPVIQSPPAPVTRLRITVDPASPEIIFRKRSSIKPSSEGFSTPIQSFLGVPEDTRSINGFVDTPTSCSTSTLN